MGSIIHCFLRNCFDSDDDRIPTNRATYEEVNFMPTNLSPRPMSVNRLQSSTTIVNVENANSNCDDTDCTNINSNNSGPLSPFNHPDNNNLHPQSNPMVMLLNRFGIGVNANSSNENEESIEAPTQREQGTSLISSLTNSLANDLNPSDVNQLVRKPRHDKLVKKCKALPSCPSPLRVANTFHAKDSTHEVPNISLDEIVIPGSALQKEMSVKMKEDLNEQEDECVICMESFDSSNPRMPTLCGCGENQTYFHLPCLYQWIEQNKNCPVCWQKLRWEEF